MTAQLIDGKALAARRRDAVRLDVARFRERFGRAPGLDVVLVGEDPASVVYTRNKEKAAAEVGIAGRLHRLEQSTSEHALLSFVAALNADANVDGILVQMPLPKHLDPARVIDAIDPAKDVDGFHPLNAGLLASGRTGFVPCTPSGSIELICHTGVSLHGAHAVVVGRSNIVGKPMAQLLLARHATVTIAHSRTRELAALCRSADVLVAAVGQAKLITGDFIKPGAVVIDVGMNRLDGKLCGDVDSESAALVAGWLTPVPGGVGPMTIAYLLANTVIAATRRAGG
ncbi:MAG: bifunctional methylenetetrahydrofolate dehydrogenase/methenyltetrahydrofolate cyclohydrolase FolD [Myxococcales bacterium]|nr:bifunctional methylenetetrahydrofolate dehydrogenase/methenyltetrahydrofolate cyclohydrolase FolD [Myxococcales bacterium]